MFGNFFGDLKEDIPHELILYIFSFCDTNDLTNFARVNKKWKAMAEDDFLWKTFVEGWLPHSVSVETKAVDELWGGWKDRFRGFVCDSVDNLSVQQMSSLKDIFPFLSKAKEEGANESKVLEFLQIWLDSFPEKMHRTKWTKQKRQFKLWVRADFLHLCWNFAAQQNHYVPRAIDFFWNVGAPESEIDKLHNLGTLLHPVTVLGSWIEISSKGGMDGGWYFPSEFQMDKALDAADSPEGLCQDFQHLKAWIEKHSLNSCYSIKRDMGAVPPHQTEFKFKLPGDFETQLRMAEEAIAAFGFPEVPADIWELLTRSKRAGIRISVTITGVGFARVGVLFPKPPLSLVRSLCAGNVNLLRELLGVLRFPKFVEYFYRKEEYGYGVYDTGHAVGFHFCVNGPDAVF